jgi:uncharacterized protein (DUF1778 family)
MSTFHTLTCVSVRYSRGPDAELQDELLRRAAEARGEPVSDYVLRHAVQAAEADLADRRVFLVDDQAWNRLVKSFDGPPKRASRLRRLLREPSTLER